MVTKLHKYVYRIKTMCCEQDGQLSLSQSDAKEKQQQQNKQNKTRKL